MIRNGNTLTVNKRFCVSGVSVRGKFRGNLKVCRPSELLCSPARTPSRRNNLKKTIMNRSRKQLYRILIILLIILLPSVAVAQEKKQTVTIQQTDISLKEVFVLIETQTNYSIAYEQSEIGRASCRERV